MATASVRIDQDLFDKATVMAKTEKEAGKLEAYSFD